MLRKIHPIILKIFTFSHEAIRNGIWLNKITAKDEGVLVNNYVGENLLFGRKESQSKPYFEKALFHTCQPLPFRQIISELY